MKILIRANETGRVTAYLNGKMISVQEAFKLVHDNGLKVTKSEFFFYELNTYFE